jgi:hypothetical protein
MIYCSFDLDGRPFTDIPLPAAPEVGTVITFSHEEGRYKVGSVEYHVDVKPVPARMFANISLRKMRR